MAPAATASALRGLCTHSVPLPKGQTFVAAEVPFTCLQGLMDLALQTGQGNALIRSSSLGMFSSEVKSMADVREHLSVIRGSAVALERQRETIALHVIVLRVKEPAGAFHVLAAAGEVDQVRAEGAPGDMLPAGEGHFLLTFRNSLTRRSPMTYPSIAPPVQAHPNFRE